MTDLSAWLPRIVDAVDDWQVGFGPYEADPSLQIDAAVLSAAVEELTSRLGGNYPFFHPRYAGQMLKPPHPAAVIGYVAAMLINPNNHALDGGRPTAAMEHEVVAALATMFRFREHLGHLTSSGTIANLEALFVAREEHPGKRVAYGSEAHYTHARMCHLLSVEGVSVPTDNAGRMDLTALKTLLATGNIGTVVSTAGTTSLGAIDPIADIVELAHRYGARVHVDAAYGGFFTLLAGHELDPTPWHAIARCDSVVIDPHKHGLQPYGCGAVLFRDPAVGRHFAHDSPYTYFTSDELHLGEISLECSRAGAAAAALWLTLRVLPLDRDGLGAVLAATRRAALAFAADLPEEYLLYQQPDLDIVTYLPRTTPLTTSAIDAQSGRVFAAGMSDPSDPLFLSVLTVTAEALRARHPEVIVDSPTVRLLRSVLMKPEHEAAVPQLLSRLRSLAGTT